MTHFPKRFLLATLSTATLLASGAAFAANPPADHKPSMPAVVTDETPAAIAPAAGRNSFTEKQATQQLMDKGYTKISGLTSDKDGIWRGTAMKGAIKQKIAVDYQGNVTAE